MQGVSPRSSQAPTPSMREPLRFRQARLALLQLLFLYSQGLGSEPPVNPGRQQSHPEDDKGDNGNSTSAQYGDAYGMRQVRRHPGGSEIGGGHAGVMHHWNGGSHHDGSG